MRIIFITREGYSQPGARLRSYGFAEEIRKRGIATEVFSFADHLGAKAGADERDFTLKEKIRLIIQGFKSLKNKKGCVFVVNRFNYHTLPVWAGAVFTGNPWVFDMDDWEASERIGYYFKLIPKSKSEYLTRIFARHSIYCIASSHYLEDYLSQFNKKVYYLPTPVDLNLFKPGPFKDNDSVIFSWHGSVNRPEIVSYIKFIIDCFSVLYQKYPFIRLSIAGDGIFGVQLRQLIGHYECPGIIYHGLIDYRKIPDYLDSIDIGLVPLLDKTRFNCAKSPTKLMEYMAKAKPTVSSNIGEAGYIIRDGGNGFLANNKQEFIEKMEALVLQKDIRLKLGEAAFRTVEKEYSLTVVSEQLYKILTAYYG